MTTPGPGRYEGNESYELARELDAMASSGIIDDECGDTETIGWHGLLILDDMDFDVRALDGFEPGTEAFVLHTDSQGFFSYEPFESADAARIVFEQWQTEELKGEES